MPMSADLLIMTIVTLWPFALPFSKKKKRCRTTRLGLTYQTIPWRTCLARCEAMRRGTGHDTRGGAANVLGGFGHFLNYPFHWVRIRVARAWHTLSNFNFTISSLCSIAALCPKATTVFILSIIFYVCRIEVTDAHYGGSGGTLLRACAPQFS